MAHVELDELLPFIVDMCKRVNHDPTQEERRLMKKILVPELSIFFDAMVMGMDDRETLDKIMWYLHMREKNEHHKFNINAEIPDDHRCLTKNQRKVELKPMVPTQGNLSAMDLTHNLTVEVQAHKHQYTVCVKNKNKEAFVAIRFYMGNSDNLKPQSSPESIVMKDGKTLTATIPAQREIILGSLLPIDPSKPTQVVYKAATQIRRWAGIADEKESEQGTRRNTIGQNVFAEATPSNHGYELAIDNQTSTKQKIVIDFSASKNLKLRTQGEAEAEEKLVTVTVPPKTKIPVVELMVDDDDLCSSQMHYNVKSVQAV